MSYDKLPDFPKRKLIIPPGKQIKLLTLSWWKALSYRNHSKLMEWFLYDGNFNHGKVNKEITESCKLSS